MRDPKKTIDLNTSIQVTVEGYVADALKSMAQFTKMSEGEIVNTALRRYIATHKDQLPKDKVKDVMKKGA